MEETLKAYEDLGKKWLANEVIIESFGDMQLTPKQIEFVNNKDKELLISGGYRSGKTVGLIIKMYLLCMFFPNNRILLGRKSRSDIDSTLIPAIQDIFPSGTYNYKVGPGIIEFPNGSQILLFSLDTNVGGDDTKKATQKIRGLDLGGAFIDQLEETDQVIWDQLAGRMSRNVPFRQKAATTNPANFWAYSYFKSNPRPGTHLIETGMLDNKQNLPEGFIEDQLVKGELYVKRFVYGIWDTETMTEGRVFSSDIDKAQRLILKSPIREVAGIKIFHEPMDHEYQIGIDPSTGAEDPTAIVCVDKFTGEVVATFNGFVPTHVITAKTIILTEMYNRIKKPLVIPEATGIGQALVEDLKKQYDNIYEREVFSKRESKKIDKLGFYTNYATKMQLIENMNKLFQSNWPKLRDEQILEEMRSFVWANEAKKQGAGAPHSFHDDRVMATMLAYWNLKPINHKQRNILENRQETITKVKYEYQ
jgi:hypothetical protein